MFKWRQLSISVLKINPVINYLLKIHDGGNESMCKICSKLTIKTPKRRQWSSFGVFIINFKLISYIVLVFPLMTPKKLTSAWNLLL